MGLFSTAAYIFQNRTPGGTIWMTNAPNVLKTAIGVVAGLLNYFFEYG